MGKRRGRESFFKDNGLSLAFLGFFIICIGIQSGVGLSVFNADQANHGQKAISYVHYLVSAHFWQAVSENWESEFLQMAMYVLLTAFLFQRGSSESKDPDEQEESETNPLLRSPSGDAPWPVRKGGTYRAIYSRSLGIAFMLLFVLSFAIHGLTGVRKRNAELNAHGLPPETAADYFVSSDFWEESMQNWQSEFLSVFAMVFLSIFLRQKGSPESKPVAAPHSSTGG